MLKISCSSSAELRRLRGQVEDLEAEKVGNARFGLHAPSYALKEFNEGIIGELMDRLKVMLGTAFIRISPILRLVKVMEVRQCLCSNALQFYTSGCRKRQDPLT